MKFVPLENKEKNMFLQLFSDLLLLIVLNKMDTLDRILRQSNPTHRNARAHAFIPTAISCASFHQYPIA